MSASAAARASRAACASLMELKEFREARVVMLYTPIPLEVDCIELALSAWQDDKTVLLPKVDWSQRHMLALQCRSLDDEMVMGRHGIDEPAGGEPWPLEEIDFIVVPALAYDRHGNRLGRGGGFYDKFLASGGMRAVTCGLGFAQQVLDRLPTTSTDYPLDLLVTDEEVLRFDLR